jgi:hypothetical protein
MLPQLLNPLAAALAAAVAVPLLLLLYFLKLRRSPAPVPTTLLWKKSIQDLQVNSPFQKLRRNLLLFVQLLLLLLLILAIARPVAEGAQAAGSRSILLIDRSASMAGTDGEGGTRLDEAKERAQDLIGTMSRGDEAMIVAFSDDDGTVPLQPFTQDRGLLRAAVDEIAITDRVTDPAAAYELANASSSLLDERLREGDLQSADVFLFSDGRVAPMAATDLSIRGVMHYERIGTTDADNVGIVAASVRRTFEDRSEAQAFARVINSGPEPVTAAVRVSVAPLPDAPTDEPLDFSPVASGPIRVTLPPHRWTDETYLETLRVADPAAVQAIERRLGETERREAIDVRLSLPRAAAVRFELVEDGTLADREDALAADNVAYVVVPPPEPVKALVVLRTNFWLRLLVETQGLDEPRFVTPSEYEELLASGEAEDFDVTLFDNHTPSRLPDAGTFVFSGALPPADATAVRPVTSGDGVATFYEASTVLDWERDHPMLRGLNLNEVFVAEGRLVTVPLGVDLLMEGVDGPMMLLEERGRRTNLILTFDLAQSNWPTRRSYPVFGYQMFEYLAGLGEVRARESVRPGDIITVPAPAVSRSNLSADDEVRLVGADQTLTSRVSDAGTLTLGPVDRVGLYRTDPPVSNFEQLAVSLLDETESNLLTAPTDPGNLAKLDAAAIVAHGEAAEQTTQIEWWWYLVAASIGVLMVEWLLYTRRVGL